jgi:hypothetical protein
VTSVSAELPPADSFADRGDASPIEPPYLEHAASPGDFRRMRIRFLRNGVAAG